MHPEGPARVPYVTRCLGERPGPLVAATDYLRSFADQIRAFVPAGRTYRVLGTDGFGRSDTRPALRRFFEVDRHFVVLAALRALADAGTVPVSTVSAALVRYGIDPETPDPVTV